MNGDSRSPWTDPGMVAGFSQSAPNARLIQLGAAELRRSLRRRVIDLGCGAGRNAVPLAAIGWDVFGLDSSRPMIEAAQRRVRAAVGAGRIHLALARMDHIPAREAVFDLVIAHGIWNLAQSGPEFRRAISEAGRVASPGATLFVFTFSRATLAPDAEPVPGETFVFRHFSGEPQCFLTEAQLTAELEAAGFTKAPGEPLRELNRPSPREVSARSAPVILEGVFHFRA
jgi:SAM-dependent methyltransferase